MSSRRLKVALVGCGQIADAHLQEIRKLACAQVVAVCDRHADLAAQAAARFGVPATFDDVGRMLREVRPDVVHITTPPQTHAALGLQAIEAGAHVYMEKPFTLDVGEADAVLGAARERGLQVCVGHDQLFDPAWLECRRRHARGEFGRIVHIDAVMGYHLGGPFGRLFASDPDHWVHRLPGGLFHNTISHALYKITDFLPDENPRVWATWFGPHGALGKPTELRVFLQGAEASANLIFTSSARPVQRLARLYGTKQSVEVDLEGQVLRGYRAANLPGPFAKLQIPFRQMLEAARSLARNFKRFLGRDLHYFGGMANLFRAFYGAILRGGEPPIPPQEIRRVTAIMDEIFRACRQDERENPPAGRGAAGLSLVGRVA